MTKRTLPDIRKRLLVLADDLDDDESQTQLSDIATEIRGLCEESKRRFGGRRAKPKRSRLTPEIAAQILHWAKLYQDASYADIAGWVGTDIGRVSEALIGFRGEKT